MLEGEDLVEADFSDRRIEGLTVVACRFLRCRFERLEVDGATFGAGYQQSLYTDCSFDGSRFAGTSWDRARFERCSFRDVHLKGLFGFDAEFVDCTFTGRTESLVFHGAPLDTLADDRALAADVADLLPPGERAALQERLDAAPPDRTHNDFHGNDLTGLELVDVSFSRGIDLTMQRLPDGHTLVLDARAAIARAREQVRFSDDDEERRVALAHLRDLAAMPTTGRSSSCSTPTTRSSSS